MHVAQSAPNHESHVTAASGGLALFMKYPVAAVSHFTALALSTVQAPVPQFCELLVHFLHLPCPGAPVVPSI